MTFQFIPGPTGQGMSDQDFLTSALDQPLSLTSTAAQAVKGGVLDSFYLGTELRDTALPQEPQTTQESIMQTAEGLLPLRLFSAIRGAKALTQDQSPLLSEDDYKASPSFREGIPWDKGMTQARAAALADSFDARQVRDFYSRKRPITAFFGNLAGQAVDPINYIPIAGEAVAAANVARFGRIGGRALTASADAMANTAIAGLASAPVRESFGDDVSWQTTLTQIGMAGLIGAAFGGISGAIGGRTDAKAMTEATDSLSTLENVHKSRIALNDAIDGMVRDGEVRLSETSAGYVNDAISAINERANTTFPDAQERADTIDRLAREGQPIGKAPKQPQSLLDFLAGNGGIQDEAGALSAMDLSGRFIPGRGALVRKSGMSLDKAREAVAEAGFLNGQFGTPERAVQLSTPDDLLRLIDKEASGSPVYSEQQDAHLIAARGAYEESVKAHEQYRRVLEDVDGALRDLGIEHKVDDSVLTRAAELSAVEGKSTVDAVEQAMYEDYRRFSELMSEQGQGISNEPDFHIPFFGEADASTGRNIGAPGKDGGASRSGGNAAAGEELPRPRPNEGKAGVDTSAGRTALQPEDLADAAKMVGKPDNLRAMSEQYRVNPETGDFPEMADIEQMRASGRLTPEDEAALSEAEDTFKQASGYGEALKAFSRCEI